MTFGLAAISAGLTALTTPSTAATGPMSLDDAVTYALRNAFAVRLQLSAVSKNQGRINEAKASAYPQWKTTTTYTRNEKAITTTFGQTSFTTLPLQTTVFSSQVTFGIDIVGNIHRAIRATQLSAKSASASYDATENDVRQNTRLAFFNVLRAAETVKVLETALNDAQERFKQAQLLFNQAQIAKVELMRYETQVDQAKADLITGRNSLTLSKNQFNLAIARPIETEVELVSPTDLPVADAVAEPLIASAYKNRPDVKQWDYTVESLEIVRKAQELGLMPTLDLNLNYQRNLDSLSFGQSSDSKNAQLMLKFPIFDGGTVRAKVREAKEDENTAKIQREQLKLTIASDVRAAIANIDSAKARIANATEQIRLAEEVFRLAKVKQNAGEGTYVEVIDAETQLVQARNSLINARYDFYSSFAQLQRAVGTDQVQNPVKQVQESAQKEGKL